MKGILAEMTLDEVRAFNPEVVVLPIGSTEPHGPVLPYGTDFYQCDADSRRAVELANADGARALMYPTLPIGNNVNFKAFPFACRVKVRTLMMTVLDIIEALEEDGIRKIVIVNGHGGNPDTLFAACREHFDKTDPSRRAFVALTSNFPDEKDKTLIEHPSDHGGESETSQIMYLRPDLVREENLRDLPVGKPLIRQPDRNGVYYVKPWHLHVPAGGGGETRKSSAEKGKAIVEGAARNIAGFLVELSQAPWNPNFPYPAE